MNIATIIDTFQTYQIITLHGKIWVGANAGLQTKIIWSLHSTPLGGHCGAHNTYQRLKQRFTWKGLKQDVSNFS